MGNNPQDGQNSDDRQTELSKEMTFKLRHEEELKNNGDMDGCGFVDVGTLARTMKHETTPEELVDVAVNDEKGRYQLDNSYVDTNDATTKEAIRIRATQGHSIELDNPMTDPIRGPDEVPLALHATSEESWDDIQKCGELRRMNRTHIHFASIPKHLRGDEWAQVLLKLDVAGVVQAGIDLCKAKNGVLLSEGPIPIKYLQRVDPTELPEGWRRENDNVRKAGK